MNFIMTQVLFYIMKKLAFIFICILQLQFCLAQKLNSFTFKLGEVAYTDWKNRYGIQPVLGYSHLYQNKIKFSTELSGYYFERTGESYPVPPVGFVENKLIIENCFRIGYQIKSQEKLIYSFGAGGSVRLRGDGIVVSSGLTSGGFAETIVYSYGGIEIGGLLYFDCNYLFSDKFSMGIYTQANLYYPSKDGTSSFWEHRSPSAISFGLSTNFYFGKKQLED